MTTTGVEEAVAVLTAAEAAMMAAEAAIVRTIVVAVVDAVDEADAVGINPMVEVEDALEDVVAVTTAATAFIRAIRAMSIRKRK
jgi:hypothetical protein